MTHNLTQASGHDLGGIKNDPSSDSRLHLLSSASCSFIALMDYMEAMMKLAHNSAENKIASANLSTTVTESAANAAYDVQDKAASATEFQANMQYANMAESLGSGVIAGGSLYGQYSSTKFSRQMDAMLSESGNCKNNTGVTISDDTLENRRQRLGIHDLSEDESEVLNNYTTKLKNGTISRETYKKLVSGSGLNEPLETGKRITLKHVLEYAHGTDEFDKLLGGIGKGRDAANKDLKATLAKLQSASDIGNSIVKAVTSGVNSQQTLGQAQAQRDQGAAAEEQALSQGALQLLQDAMKTQDQMFTQSWQEAQQVYTQYVQAAVSVDSKG
ncbi:MAG: hypothetical protein FJZ59_04120 [Chlamydiae bacterium]|nr:hypothetical protein [Chlamydiota bacterium]